MCRVGSSVGNRAKNSGQIYEPRHSTLDPSHRGSAEVEPESDLRSQPRADHVHRVRHYCLWMPNTGQGARARQDATQLWGRGRSPLPSTDPLPHSG